MANKWGLHLLEGGALKMSRINLRKELLAIINMLPEELPSIAAKAVYAFLHFVQASAPFEPSKNVKRCADFFSRKIASQILAGNLGYDALYGLEFSKIDLLLEEFLAEVNSVTIKLRYKADDNVIVTIDLVDEKVDPTRKIEIPKNKMIKYDIEPPMAENSRTIVFRPKKEIVKECNNT